MEWLDKNGKALKKGDVVEWGAGHKGTVVELSSIGIRVQGYGMRGIEEWTGGSSQVRKVSNSIASSNPVVANALAVTARNAFYKTEEEAEYWAKMFIDAALSRIKGDIDDEIKTVSDCIKLFNGAPMSDKAKTDLERLKSHLAMLKKCKAMF